MNKKICLDKNVIQFTKCIPISSSDYLKSEAKSRQKDMYSTISSTF